MNLSTFWWWLVRSSKDANKTSATVKNALPLLIALGALFGTDLSWLPQGWDFFVQMAAQVTALVTTVTTAWAFFRKVKSTLGGTNDVLNNPVWR